MTGGFALWPHQQQAVDAALGAIAESGRATVVAACGTGKTVISAEVSRRVAAAGVVAVFVPTIELLAQACAAWASHLGDGVGDLVAVCSDEQSTYGVQAVREGLDRMASRVTTDPEVVASCYRAALGAGRRLTVFAT